MNQVLMTGPPSQRQLVADSCCCCNVKHVRSHSAASEWPTAQRRLGSTTGTSAERVMRKPREVVGSMTSAAGRLALTAHKAPVVYCKDQLFPVSEAGGRCDTLGAPIKILRQEVT
jgi:hypothetical protein